MDYTLYARIKEILPESFTHYNLSLEVLEKKNGIFTYSIIK